MQALSSVYIEKKYDNQKPQKMSLEDIACYEKKQREVSSSNIQKEDKIIKKVTEERKINSQENIAQMKKDEYEKQTTDQWVRRGEEKNVNFQKE